LLPANLTCSAVIPYSSAAFPLFEAKKALRKQQRKERAIERELFMKKLESKPDQKTFFQLIRRNHAEVGSKIPDCIKKGEKTAVALSHQDGRHSAVVLLLKAALIQVSDYRLLGASGLLLQWL
jgi:hypothetical protein